MARIVVFGYPSSGKTTFINSLMTVIENLAKISRGTYHEYLDESTTKTVREIRTTFNSGIFPLPASQSVVAPIRVEISNFAKTKSTILEILDYAGEALDVVANDKLLDEVVNSDVVWMVHDLSNLDISQLSNLISIYVNVISKAKGRGSQRKVVVVFTKADKAVSFLPSGIIEYLASDPYSRIGVAKARDLEAIDLDAYMRQVLDISHTLQDFVVGNTQGGAALVSRAHDYGLQLEFCIVSALGSPPTNTSLVEFQSYRVIDPLLVTLERLLKPATVGEKNDTRDTRKESRGIPVDADTIFVSYKRSDWEKFVRNLVEKLRAHGLSVWVDQHLIEGGDDWQDEIDQALKLCGRMVLCVSPDALESRHIKVEYRYFWNNNKKLYPLICLDSELPPILQSIQYFPYSRMDDLINLLQR